MKSITALKLYAGVALAAATITAAFFALQPAETHASRPAPPSAAALAPIDQAPTGLVSPITLADCAAGAQDCCDPRCRAVATGCCVATSCGVPKTHVVKGKGPFAGSEFKCSVLRGHD